MNQENNNQSSFTANSYPTPEANNQNIYQPKQPTPINPGINQSNIPPVVQSEPPQPTPEIKKSKIGKPILIITLITITIAGIILGTTLIKKKAPQNPQTNIENSTNTNDEIKNGSAKLAFSSNNPIELIDNVKAYKYFVSTDSAGNAIILNAKGETAITLSSSYTYLDKDYIAYFKEDSLHIYDLKNKKTIFTDETSNRFYIFSLLCRNDVLYYPDYESKKTYWIAYDLKNKKELWKTDKASTEYLAIRATDKHVFLNSNNFITKTHLANEASDYYPSIAIDLKGNVLIEGNTDKYEYLNLERDELEHTFIINDEYYLKVKYEQYVQVYDFSNNLITNLELKSSETEKYYLLDVYEQGYFTIWESKQHKQMLYDVHGNIILEGKNLFISYNGYESKVQTSNALVIEKDHEKNYIIKDSKIIDTFDEYTNEDISVLSSPLEGNENQYLIIEKKNEQTKEVKKQIVNLKTLEIFDSPLENLYNSLYEAPNGEYVILTTGNEYFVYDSSMNLKYESKNYLVPIDHKYILERSTDSKEWYVVNIDTKEKNKIEVKGTFYYRSNSSGFVTKENETYHLYTYN